MAELLSITPSRIAVGDRLDTATPFVFVSSGFADYIMPVYRAREAVLSAVVIAAQADIEVRYQSIVQNLILNGLLTAIYKPTLIGYYNKIQADAATYIAVAAYFNISSGAYQAAISTLTTTLPIHAPGWSNTSIDSMTNATQVEYLFLNVYIQQASILVDIANKLSSSSIVVNLKAVLPGSGVAYTAGMVLITDQWFPQDPALLASYTFTAGKVLDELYIDSHIAIQDTNVVISDLITSRRMSPSVMTQAQKNAYYAQLATIKTSIAAEFASYAEKITTFSGHSVNHSYVNATGYSVITYHEVNTVNINSLNRSIPKLTPTTTSEIYTAPLQLSEVLPVDILATQAELFSGTMQFSGGVKLYDGSIFYVPFNSTTARIYNPTTKVTTTPSGTYPGNGAFSCGIRLVSGAVLCVPYNSLNAMVYDPTLDTLTTLSESFPGNGAYSGVSETHVGGIFFVPFNATVAKIYKRDTTTGTYSFTAQPITIFPGNGAFSGGVQTSLPNTPGNFGLTFCIPYNSTQAALYDYVNDSLTYLPEVYPGNGAFSGGVVTYPGTSDILSDAYDIFMVPFNSTTARLYKSLNQVNTFTTPAGFCPGGGAFSGAIHYVFDSIGDLLCIPYNSPSAYVFSYTKTTPKMIGNVLVNVPFTVVGGYIEKRPLVVDSTGAQITSGTEFAGGAAFSAGMFISSKVAHFIPSSASHAVTYSVGLGTLSSNLPTLISPIYGGVSKYENNMKNMLSWIFPTGVLPAIRKPDILQFLAEVTADKAIVDAAFDRFIGKNPIYFDSVANKYIAALGANTELERTTLQTAYTALTTYLGTLDLVSATDLTLLSPASLSQQAVCDINSRYAGCTWVSTLQSRFNDVYLQLAAAIATMPDYVWPAGVDPKQTVSNWDPSFTMVSPINATATTSAFQIPTVAEQPTISTIASLYSINTTPYTAVLGNITTYATVQNTPPIGSTEIKTGKFIFQGYGRVQWTTDPASMGFYNYGLFASALVKGANGNVLLGRQDWVGLANDHKYEGDSTGGVNYTLTDRILNIL
jgi:hypothetical protein